MLRKICSCRELFIAKGLQGPFSYLLFWGEFVEAAAPSPEVGGFAGEGGEGVVGEPEEERVRHLLAEEFALEVERGEERRVRLARGDGAFEAVDEDGKLGLSRCPLTIRGSLLRETFAEDREEVCDGLV